MLPLLQRLLGATALEHVVASEQQPLLLGLAEQFAGGSALTWAQQASREGPAHHTATLLPPVLHTVRLLAQHIGQCTDPGQRAVLLEACHAEQWLDVVAQQLEGGQWGYAARVAALQLATGLLRAAAGCAAPDAAPQLVVAVLRRVLMPRELWSTDHCHGKAAVLAALELLLQITQVAPAAVWAEAWAGVGSTFWLSRAASDASPAVRQAALRLLAAAMAVPATRDVLARGWPECGQVAARAALDGPLPSGVRAAALGVAAAALSHGLSSSSSPAAEPGEEEAAPAACSESGSPGAAAARLAMVPHALPFTTSERLLLDEELWEGVGALLQV